MEPASASEVERYEQLLEKHLRFYESLRTRDRRPKSPAQRQFQEVAWGKAAPVTEHERAYVFYLKRSKVGPFAEQVPPKHIDDVMGDYPVGARPVGGDVGAKWDNAWRETRGGREYW